MKLKREGRKVDLNRDVILGPTPPHDPPGGSATLAPPRAQSAARCRPMPVAGAERARAAVRVVPQRASARRAPAAALGRRASLGNRRALERRRRRRRRLNPSTVHFYRTRLEDGLAAAVDRRCVWWRTSFFYRRVKVQGTRYMGTICCCNGYTVCDESFRGSSARLTVEEPRERVALRPRPP